MQGCLTRTREPEAAQRLASAILRLEPTAEDRHHTLSALVKVLNRASPPMLPFRAPGPEEPHWEADHRSSRWLDIGYRR